MGYGSASYQQSKQQQSSGLNRAQRDYFSNLAPQYVSRLDRDAQVGARDPGGLRFQSDVNRLMPVGPYGISPGSSAGVYQLGRDLTAKYSGNRSLRGFNSPNSLDAVFGDAIRMASPQLIPLSESYNLERAKLGQLLGQTQFGYQNAALDAIQKLLASSSSGSGSSFGFSAAGAGSDRRLKSDIVRIGTHPLGIGWYDYTIHGIRTQGVMAQELLEVRPDAVSLDSNGHYKVNYELIGRVG